MTLSAENRKIRHLRLIAFVRLARGAGRSWVERARGGEYVFLLFTAALIGLLGGLGAIAFSILIHLFQDGFWGVAEPHLADLKEIAVWKIALVPALGGLLVGLVTTFLVSEAKGHGVPQVIKAVALDGGKIRGRVALAKMLASAVTIGSGGSAGREGPVIQIGAAIGSRIGQAMGMSKPRLRTLVGCGAAAGIAATFNAPIAGALFAVEVILGEFGAAQFSPIVISSVIATVVARAWRGNVPIFSPPVCAFASAWELLPYALLGLLCGLVSLAYIRINDFAGRFFEQRRRLPNWLRPALGGLLVGLLALVLPQVMGDGHGLANGAFVGRFPALLLLVLVFAKMLATGLTLGSGGSGGVFSLPLPSAPCLARPWASSWRRLSARASAASPPTPSSAWAGSSPAPCSPPSRPSSSSSRSPPTMPSSSPSCSFPSSAPSSFPASTTTSPSIPTPSPAPASASSAAPRPTCFRSTPPATTCACASKPSAPTNPPPPS